MKIFIVHAHHEPQSFNGALTVAAVSHLEAQGHEVVVSDLYAMGWDPVSDRRNFTTVADAAYLNQQNEERYAAAHDGFAPDIRAEMDRLVWCDALLFQFPLWWFGLPAILKGWVDRVFALDFAYGYGRFYENGVFRGKRAMLSLTTGGPESSYIEGGMSGEMSMLLYPIQHGMLHFVGMDVVPPFVAYGPARLSQEQREAKLLRYRRHLDSLFTAEPITF
jgi:NAD(P)H dehydrogenase (quinone)